MNPLSYNYRPSACANMIDSHPTAKFLLVCFILIGISLLSMLAHVGSIAVKPLALSPMAGVPFPAQACQCTVITMRDSELTAQKITLDVEVLAADPMARTLTLDWYPNIRPSLDCAAPSPIEYNLYMSQ